MFCNFMMFNKVSYGRIWASGFSNFLCTYQKLIGNKFINLDEEITYEAI